MNKVNGRVKSIKPQKEAGQKIESFTVETSKEFKDRIKKTMERIKVLEKELEALRVFVSGVVQLEADKNGVIDGDNITISEDFERMTISRNED